MCKDFYRGQDVFPFCGDEGGVSWGWGSERLFGGRAYSVSLPQANQATTKEKVFCGQLKEGDDIPLTVIMWGDRVFHEF